MKIVCLGFSRSGKDTAAEILKQETGLSFQSSSYFCAEHFLFEKLKHEFGYKTVEECFERRHESGMRKRWFDEICAYNEGRPQKLCEAIFAEYDMYVGLRNKVELDAYKNSGEECFCIWIQRDSASESTDSCTVTKDDADLIIENNGTLEEFEAKVLKFCKIINLIPKVVKSDTLLSDEEVQNLKDKWKKLNQGNREISCKVLE